MRPSLAGPTSKTYKATHDFGQYMQKPSESSKALSTEFSQNYAASSAYVRFGNWQLNQGCYF